MGHSSLVLATMWTRARLSPKYIVRVRIAHRCNLIVRVQAQILQTGCCLPGDIRCGALPREEVSACGGLRSKKAIAHAKPAIAMQAARRGSLISNELKAVNITHYDKRPDVSTFSIAHDEVKDNRNDGRYEDGPHGSEGTKNRRLLS